MGMILSEGVPLIVGVGMFVVGFLQVTNVIRIPEIDQTSGAIIGATGLGILGFSWFVSVLSGITGISIARIIVGLAVIAGIATGIALLIPGITSYGYTTGQRVGYAISITLLAIAGLYIFKKVFFK